jgi:hypothetical protein
MHTATMWIIPVSELPANPSIVPFGTRQVKRLIKIHSFAYCSSYNINLHVAVCYSGKHAVFHTMDAQFLIRIRLTKRKSTLVMLFSRAISPHVTTVNLMVQSHLKSRFFQD